MRYIHANPVAAGMVDRGEAYVFSSAYEGAVVDPMPGWLGRG